MYSIIPLSNAPNNECRFKMTIAGTNRYLALRTVYDELHALWRLDIKDLNTDRQLFWGLPLLTGVDLFSQHQHLGLGHAYVVKLYPVKLDRPDNKSLGNIFALYWGDGDD